MEPPLPWKDTDTTDWERALSLPALLWARPFLPLMGLPNAMVEQPEVWESIHSQAIADYQTRLQTRDWEVGVPGGRNRLVQQVFSKAFQHLAAQLRQEVAIDFECWVLWHFFNEDTGSATRAWDYVLSSACMVPNTRRDQVPPPAVLTPLLPEIAELVSYKPQEINAHIESIAPPPPEDQIFDERLEHCFEATLLEIVIEQASILRALQTIAQKLNEHKRAEVIAWAQAQVRARRWGRPKPEDLQGDKYLQPELPCLELPLVLSLAALEDN